MRGLGKLPQFDVADAVGNEYRGLNALDGDGTACHLHLDQLVDVLAFEAQAYLRATRATQPFDNAILGNLLARYE